MSLKFYVNGVQIFGNNEMFERTCKELERQGAKWENGFFERIEIKDPQSLMDAVEKDSLECLKKRAELACRIGDFSEIHDSHLVLSGCDQNYLKNLVYKEDSTARDRAWEREELWIHEMRIFTGYVLYQAIKDEVDSAGGKLELKPDGRITAYMARE